MTRQRRLAVVGVLLMVGQLVAGCPSETKHNRPMRQTRVVGLAPLNGGGTARALMLDDSDPETGRAGQVLAEIAIPSDGNFIIDLEDMRGNLVLEAKGGHYKDPNSGNPVSMRDETMRAAVYGIEAGQTVPVVLTPWSELLYQYARARPGAAAHEAARLAIEKSLGCEDRKLTQSFPVVPSSEVPLRASGNAEIAYVHLAAWGLLAETVSQELGLGDKGVSMAHLVRVLGAALATSAKVEGALEILPGKFLPPDILRQRFAQAVRQFLDRNRPDITLETKSVANLLNCTSHGFSDMWGPIGEPLDTDGPSVTLDEPKVLAAAAQIACVASDMSDVASIAFEAKQGTSSYVGPPVFAHEAAQGRGTPEAKLLVTFDPSSLAAGNVDITCRAIDRWGNASSQSVTYGINKGLARATTHVEPIEQRDSGLFVRGKVKITCACEDPFPEPHNGCALDDASLWMDGIRFKSLVPGGAIYEWDTNGLPDGENTVACQARTRGFSQPIADPRKVRIANHRPMHVKGTVSLETPVHGMTIKAWAWRGDGSRGALLASAEAQDGTFVLTLTNEYQGPLLIEATPSQAEGSQRAAFESLATKQTMYLNHAHRLALVWENYTPAAQLPPLNINAATTIAVAYAQALVTDKDNETLGNPTRAIAQAQAFIGQHIQKDGSFDPRTTPVGDLSSGGRVGAGYQNSVLSALFHVGLSRLVAEQSEGLDRFSTLDLLAAIAMDFGGDGLLDGLGERGDRIGMGQYALSSETLRRDLAHATRRWLGNAPLHGQIYEVSSLDPMRFSRPEQYLRWVTGNNATAFGGVAAQEFDVEPPQLNVRVRGEGHDWSEDPEQEILRGFVDIHVDAIDDSEVVNLSIRIQGDTGDLKSRRQIGLGSDHAYAEYSWNSRVAPDGLVTMIVTATDRVGNTRKFPMDIAVSNIPPQITAPPSRLVNNSNVVLTGTTDRPFAAVRVLSRGHEIARLDAPKIDDDSEIEPLRSFAIPVVVACNAMHTLALVAEDEAGNQGHEFPIDVICDDQPPSVNWSPTAFKQDFTGQHIGIPQNGVVIEKYIHDMDEDGDNLPIVQVLVDDRQSGKIGSTPEQVSVEWKVEYGTGDGKRTIDWVRYPMMQINEHGAGLYQIRLSYQTMLDKAVRSMDVGSARRSNYVALSKESDEYLLSVRAQDEAGNISATKTFQFHMRMRSAPVRLRCSNIGNVSPNQLAYLARTGTHALRNTLAWEVPQNKKHNKQSLSPQIEGVDLHLTVAGAALQWEIRQSLMQFAVLKRDSISYDSMNRGHECADHGNSWAMVFDDGECAPHPHDTHNSQWYRPETNLRFEQVLRPINTREILHGGHQPIIVSYAASGGPLLKLVSDYRGNARLQSRYRKATDFERHVHWGSPDRVWLDERRFVAEMSTKWAFPVPTIEAVGGGGDFPLPSKVETEGSCYVDIPYRDAVGAVN